MDKKMEAKKYKTISDLNIKLSVPFNNDIKLIDRLVALKSYVDSVYLPLHFSIFPTSGGATNWDDFRDVDKYNEFLAHLILKLKRNDIKARIVLNATVFDFREVLEHWPKSKLFKNLEYLCNKSDLKYLTVSDLPLAMKINDTFPHLKITISANAFVDNFERLSYWMESVTNIEGVIPDIKINKNLAAIEDIKKTSGLKVGLISEACLSNCPYREAHANTVALGLERYFDCLSRNKVKPWLVYKLPVIVPYNLRFYKGLIDYVKLYGRFFSTEKILSHLNHYIFNINSREYAIDNWGIDKKVIEGEPKSIFKKVSSCNRHCDQCNYCYSLWKKLNHVSDSYIHVVNGFDYQQKNQFKEATIEYDKIKSVENKNLLASFYVLKHKCYLELKEYDKAISVIKNAIALEPDNKNNYMFFASCYEQAGMNDQALKVYREGMKKFLDDGEFYAGLAEIYFKLKNYKKAILAARRAFKLKYEKANMHLLLGFCYENIKQYKKAINELKKAESVNLQEPKISLSLSNCYRKLGQEEEANKELDKAYAKFTKT